MYSKKSLLLVLFGYVLWGVLPLYWHALNALNAPVFVIAVRFVMSAVTMLVFLAATGRLKEFWATLKNPRIMKLLVPASVFMSVNWVLFLWAVSAGRVVDSSLGYYMNPLFVFLFGVVIFKERCEKLELIALLLAGAGVLFAALEYGQVPYTAISIAVTFGIYAMFKKFAHVDGVISIAIETSLIAPFALLYLLFAPESHAVLSSATAGHYVLLLFTGVLTAVPFILYTLGVNELPFVVLGFLQYICPTISLLISVLVFGEPFGPAQAVCFGFIGAGLVLFSINMVQKWKRQRAAVAVPAEAQQSV